MLTYTTSWSTTDRGYFSTAVNSRPLQQTLSEDIATYATTMIWPGEHWETVQVSYLYGLSVLPARPPNRSKLSQLKANGRVTLPYHVAGGRRVDGVQMWAFDCHATMQVVRDSPSGSQQGRVPLTDRGYVRFPRFIVNKLTDKWGLADWTVPR